MNFTIVLTLALAALVAACAPAQPVASRQVVFVDARTGCRYALATDGRRLPVGRCTPRRWGGVL
jgi:hypothetical protein